MKNTYKTRFIYHLKSSKYIFIGLFFTTGVFYLITSGQDENFSFSCVVILVLLFVSPGIYLHLNYYSDNIGRKMVIDEDNKLITLIQNGEEYHHYISNISTVEQHLGIYYRDRVDHKGRKITPWTPYGYLLLKFDDGSQYFITSLMIDVLNPPLKITHTYFRFLPYLKAGIKFADKRGVIDNNYQNAISQYRLTFESHSKEQLIEKIKNEKTYDKAAVEATKQLLNTKFEIKVE